MSSSVPAPGASRALPDHIVIVTSDLPPQGYEVVETLGLVRGNTIRARHLGSDILAGLRTLVGGEITEYTKLMGESREQAIDRMRAEAAALGADAILATRITTSTVMGGAAEILAYGTAVRTSRLP